MSNNKAILHKDIQSLICKLPDIISCSVICDKEGTIEEIHVLAAVGRNIKQMVRDIQSAINAKFNISVDYKKISIAQINEAEFKETRVRIEGIQVKNVNNAIEAEVALSYDDKVYQGRSSKVKSRSNRAKAVAEATLAALEACIGISGVLYLEGLENFKVSDKEVFVSLVGFSKDNIDEYYSGSSIISLDENESAVKAVLAAVNRKVNTVA
ncbi:MAG TPA: hypothetical protein PLS45_05170 [Bacillota bacterium]|nr:hypothetical protein [Clostridia bacterium]HPL99266.1 hypothetical protein [Bacillota bacterium]HPW42012.1 hypothetical protein [Bacillota bacterium]